MMTYPLLYPSSAYILYSVMRSGVEFKFAQRRGVGEGGGDDRTCACFADYPPGIALAGGRRHCRRAGECAACERFRSLRRPGNH